MSGEDLTAYAIGVRATLSLAVLLVPTALMGATLPLLTDVLRRSRYHGHSWRVGLLYAANTFGAAAGVFAASFVLIELIGVRGTTWIAASLNLIVACAAYAVASWLPLAPRDADSGRTLPRSRDGWLALAFTPIQGEKPSPLTVSPPGAPRRPATGRNRPCSPLAPSKPSASNVIPMCAGSLICPRTIRCRRGG